MNKAVKLSNYCEINLSEYANGARTKEVTLDYVEHSSDYWHSDTETSVDIDKTKAMEIIALLQEFVKEDV